MRKKFRIAQIAPVWIPVPPRTYGGIELFLSLLVEELVRRNHKITLFASGDSQTTADLVSTTEKALCFRRNLRSPHAIIVRMMKQIFNRQNEFDLIHNNFDFFMYPLLLCKNAPPILTTLHRPIDEEMVKVARLFPEMNFCAISNDQKKQVESYGIRVVGMVYNGIDPSNYPFNNQPKDYFAYLGRLNQEKGIIDALTVARKAGVKLVVAGNTMGDAESNFFEKQVMPLLKDGDVDFIGQVNFKQKISLLSNAKALLFPIDREEPFGLVMIESMACGTPVIAYRRGSVPEVISKNTGFIVETKDEMVEAIKNISLLKRSDCRQHVENNFTLRQMVDQYEKLYQQLI